MSSNEFEGEQGQAWVMEVAEAAVEPSYYSEISRKLIEAGIWNTGVYNGTRRVSIAVDLFIRNHDEDDFRFERIQAGQREGSPHYKLGSGEDNFDGVSPSDEWRPYNLFWNKSTEYEDITQEEIQDFVDPSVTFEEKRERIHTISSMGKMNSENAELILQDQIRPAFMSHTPRPTILEKIDTGFNDPGVDSLVKAQSPELPKSSFAFEISVRWDNPIGVPYLESKRKQALNMEAEVGTTVDTVMMAPDFAGDFESEFVHQYILPTPLEPALGKVLGTPIIVADPPETVELAEGSAVVGENYPIVTRDFEEFREFLTSVGRSFRIVEELEYRAMIATNITDLLP